MATQKKSQSKNIYKTTIAELKKNGDYNEIHSLTKAITLKLYDTAADIAITAYSELDILKRQLQSITRTLPSATFGRQEHPLGLIFGVAGALFSLFNYINTAE